MEDTPPRKDAIVSLVNEMGNPPATTIKIVYCH